MDDSASTLRALLPLVSARTGIVKTLKRVARNALEPPSVHLYQATLSHFDFRTADYTHRLTAGKAATPDGARLAALGEAIERYCGFQFDPARIRRCAESELDGDFISPTACVLYSESQYATPGFPFRRYDPRNPIGWVQGRRLPGGEPVWLPASFVYLGYFGEAAADYFCMPTSNGLAAGPDPEFACLNGLCESIERDAFLITWMNRLPPRRILCSRASALSKSMLDHWNRSGVEVHALLLPADHPIPVVLAIGVQRQGGPAAAIGIACHPDPNAALEKALLEMCQARVGGVLNSEFRPAAHELARHQDVRDLPAHSAFFTLPEHLDELAFLTGAPGEIAIEDIPNLSKGDDAANLALCVDAMRSIGCEAAFAEVTTPDLDAFPIRAFRAIATGLQPIHFGYGLERMGGRRIFEVPRRLGLARADATEDSFNRCPHPLG